MMQGADPKLLDALSRASSLELFQLQSIIERMLADPKRIIAVRINMHLGQTVRFMDWRDGQMRSGKVVEMRDTQAVLHESATRCQWSSNNPQLWSSNFPHPSTPRSRRWKRNFETWQHPRTAQPRARGPGLRDVLPQYANAGTRRNTRPT